MWAKRCKICKGYYTHDYVINGICRDCNHKMMKRLVILEMITKILGYGMLIILWSIALMEIILAIYILGKYGNTNNINEIAATGLMIKATIVAYMGAKWLDEIE